MIKGLVKFFKNDTGYGFITVSEGAHKGKDIFVHHTQIKTDGYRTLHKDEECEFELFESEKGLQAQNVVPNRQYKPKGI